METKIEYIIQTAKAVIDKQDKTIAEYKELVDELMTALEIYEMAFSMEGLV